jgi:uncharacterized membrane protein
MCGLLLYEAVARGSQVLLFLLLLFAGGTLVKLFAFDLPAWSVSERLLYGGPYSFRDGLLRLLDFGAVIAFFGFTWTLLARRATVKQVAAGFGFAALALLFVYLTLEANSFLYHFVPGLRSGGVSIVWSLFALALILRGISRHVRVLRYLGLGLFAVVAWKVFFVDLATLDQFYRIIAFIVLGVLALCGSYLYLRFRETFAANETAKEEAA